MSVGRNGGTMARLRWAAWVSLCAGLAGCVNPWVKREPFPHPLVPHEKWAFTDASPRDEVAPLGGGVALGVCDFQSGVVDPVGGYMVDGELKRLFAQEVAGAQLADALCQELGDCGVSARRIEGQTGNVLLMSPGQTQGLDEVLKGTVLAMEYSQHGNDKNPYDFCYMIVSFSLLDPHSGRCQWKGQVAGYRKTQPGPKRSQVVLATETVRDLARRLMGNPSFREAAHKNRRQ